VKVIYRVKRGDTLSSLARRFKTTVESLMSWNPRLPEPKRLAAGARLTIYTMTN